MNDLSSSHPSTPPDRREVNQASLDLLYEIGREVTGELDLHTLLHRVLFLAMKNVGATSGSLIVIDEDGQPGESAFLMQGQSQSQTALQLRVTYEQGMAGWVARHRQAVLAPDTSQDERWLRRPDDAADRTGAKSAVSAPILSGEQLVGVITLVHPHPGFFTIEHLHLTETIADWAGAAILRARLVDRLQAANQRYRELFEDSIDPILITNWQGEILECNRRAQCLIGLNLDELYSLKIHTLHSPDERKLGPEFQHLRDGAMLEYESMLHTFTAQDIPVQVYVRSIHYDGASHLQWILRDITERKDLDRLREDLIAMVYHDLRSPLANISSSLEVLAGLSESAASDTITTLLQIALRSTERIQRLTDSLLDLNRLEAGQVVGQRQPAALPDLMTEALDTVALLVKDKKMQVELNSAPGLPEVMIDCDMIRRVIINLLENALKYSPAGGQIWIKLTPAGEFVQASIRDQGPGIPVSDQERVFEKFTRLRGKEGPRGLGLGLAFCRLAVTSHSGRIWVESQPGQGSAFKFTLPVAPAAPPDQSKD